MESVETNEDKFEVVSNDTFNDVTEDEDKSQIDDEVNSTEDLKEIENNTSLSDKFESNPKSLVHNNDIFHYRIWWGCFITVFVLGIGSRQLYLNSPGGTTWDEVHFGKFMNHYINRTFYHDVHPPLGKMMIAGTGWLTGYTGNFSFDSGTVYQDINYLAIRSVMGLMGGALVPMTFLIVWELSFSVPASFISSIFILSDTYLHRIGTLILLDPILLISILASVYCSFKFHNLRSKCWQRTWWCHLCATGVCLGIVISIKFIGVFTVVMVGIHTAYQLVIILTDSTKSVWSVIPHIMARALCLIILPLIVYLFSFILHFLVLTEWEPNGGGFYNTRFFSSFNNTEYDNVTFPKYIAYGDTITLQSDDPMIGYLESSEYLFPREITAPCQQVVVTPIKDDYTKWTLQRVNLADNSVFDSKTNKSVLVRNGDHVMLTHLETGRSLRSHNHRAPITRRHYQICGYGDDGKGGSAETWKIIFPGGHLGEPLELFKTSFVLLHNLKNCFLAGSSHVKLPKSWSYDDAKETSCSRNYKYPGVQWHVNWVTTDKVGNHSAGSVSMSLFEKLLYIHKAILVSNQGLKPSEEELDNSAKPWMWPIMFQAQTFCAYEIVGTEEERIAIGIHNPIVAYLNVLALFGSFILFALHHYYDSRYPEQFLEAKERRHKTLIVCGWLLTCWWIHYMPFWGMSRILYTHHYLPSYMFSCMISGVLVSYVFEELVLNIDHTRRYYYYMSFIGTLITLVIGSYVVLWPLATSLRGNLGEKHPRISLIFDYFNFGQRWHELGYNYNGTKLTWVQLIALDKNNLKNEHLNATLYYSTDLNVTRHPNTSDIIPVSSSNYLSWRYPTTPNNIFGVSFKL